MRKNLLNVENKMGCLSTSILKNLAEVIKKLKEGVPADISHKDYLKEIYVTSCKIMILIIINM